MNERRDVAKPDRRRTLSRPGGRRATDPPADWISIAAYAVRYGVNRHTVYKWLDADILDTYQAGSILRIRNLPPDQHHKCAPACATETAASPSRSKAEQHA